MVILTVRYRNTVPVSTDIFLRFNLFKALPLQKDPDQLCGAGS